MDRRTNDVLRFLFKALVWPFAMIEETWIRWNRNN